MPPQPLSSVNPKAKINLLPYDVGSQPILAAGIASCISEWAHVELSLGTLMTAFLGRNAAPTVAIYLELIAFRTRIQALNAAAAKTLSVDNKDIFDAIVSLSRSAAKKRDRLAHWIWSASPDVPDSLLLFDPRDRVSVVTDVIIKALDGQQQQIEYDSRQIWVYRLDDFRELYLELANLRLWIHRLIGAVIFDKIDPERTHQLYAQLLEQPRIGQFVSRQREARRKSQSAPE